MIPNRPHETDLSWTSVRGSWSHRPIILEQRTPRSQARSWALRPESLLAPRLCAPRPARHWGDGQPVDGDGDEDDGGVGDVSAPPRESGSRKYRGYARPRGELLGTDAEHHDPPRPGSGSSVLIPRFWRQRLSRRWGKNMTYILTDPEPVSIHPWLFTAVRKSTFSSQIPEANVSGFRHP